MHSTWIFLRKAAPLLTAAVLASALFSASASVDAQMLQKAGAEATRSTAGSALAPARTVAGGDSASALAPHSANTRELPQARPNWLVWGATGLGVLLLGAAGLGLRFASSAADAQPVKRTHHRKLRSGQDQAEEFLGAETWVPGMRASATPANHAITQPVALANAAAPVQSAPELPRGFDDATFMREAKALFMRLTSAWGAQDQAEMQRLVMPHELALLTQQVGEAYGDTGAVNFLTLEAQVLRVTQYGQAAEVRFHGLYRAAHETAASPFDCVWSLVNDSDTWRLAAIQGL